MRTNLSSARHLPSRFALLLIPCAAIALTALAMPKSVLAQEAAAKKYNVLPFDPAMKRDLNVPRILRGDDGWKIEDKPELDEYLKQYLTTYIFAEMTLPENVQRLPELRQLFFKKIWQAKNLKAYEAVNKITHDTVFMLFNPSKNFHPAVQYNAILLLGELDVAPRAAGGRQEKPVAWPGALELLIKCATATSLPDHIRAGALIGLERHAEFGLTPDNRDSIANTALLVIQEKIPQGRSREVHDWMRRRACEILGLAGVTGGANNVPNVLIAAMNDPQATLAFRCCAADALGKLRYQGGALGIETAKLSAGLGDLALAICNDTKAKAKTAVDPSIAELIARQASMRLGQLKTGFIAPATIGEDGDKSLAKDVSTQVELLLADMKSGNITSTVLDEATHQIALRMGKAVAAPEKTAPTEATPGTPTAETPSAGQEPAPMPPAADPLGDF